MARFTARVTRRCTSILACDIEAPDAAAARAIFDKLSDQSFGAFSEFMHEEKGTDFDDSEPAFTPSTEPPEASAYSAEDVEA